MRRCIFYLNTLRLEAEKLGIRKLEIHKQGGRIDFLQETSVQPKTIISLLQKYPKIYEFQAPNVLRFKQALTEPEERFTYCEQLLESLYA
jgi:transcription-repair coupling factor (superfamily II helicase)